jgi:hypothetical protein
MSESAGVRPTTSTQSEARHLQRRDARGHAAAREDDSANLSVNMEGNPIHQQQLLAGGKTAAAKAKPARASTSLITRTFSSLEMKNTYAESLSAAITTVAEGADEEGDEDEIFTPGERRGAWVYVAEPDEHPYWFNDETGASVWTLVETKIERQSSLALEAWEAELALFNDMSDDDASASSEDVATASPPSSGGSGGSSDAPTKAEPRASTARAPSSKKALPFEAKGRRGSAPPSTPPPPPNARGTNSKRLTRAASASMLSRRRHVMKDAAKKGECSFIYRYIVRESCSQFDSIPNIIAARRKVKNILRLQAAYRGNRCRKEVKHSRILSNLELSSTAVRKSLRDVAVKHTGLFRLVLHVMMASIFVAMCGSQFGNYSLLDDLDPFYTQTELVRRIKSVEPSYLSVESTRDVFGFLQGLAAEFYAPPLYAPSASSAAALANEPSPHTYLGCALPPNSTVLLRREDVASSEPGVSSIRGRGYIDNSNRLLHSLLVVQQRREDGECETVSFLLYTVTFNANLAHSLTRSP